MNLVRQRETVRKQQEFLKTEGKSVKKSVDRIKGRTKRNAIRQDGWSKQGKLQRR